MKKIIKFFFTMVVSLLLVGNVYGQDFPDFLPDWNYDIQTGTKGFLRLINRTGSYSPGIFSIATGRTDSPGVGELFRVTSNGVTSLSSISGLQSVHLNFHQQAEKYGSINTVQQNLNIDATRQLRLSARGVLTTIFENNSTSIYTPLSLFLSTTVPGGLLINSGKNGDPTISSTYDSWLRIGGKRGVAIWGDDTSATTDSPILRVENNVGVGFPLGTVVPDKLSVTGAISAVNNGITTVMTVTGNKANAWFGTRSNHGLDLGTNNNSIMHIDNGSNVYVGLTVAQRDAIRPEIKAKYQLLVAKGVLSEDFAIAPINSWADHVFSAGYELMDVNELKTYIVENKHLPAVPSAKEVAEKGYSQHDMNKILLQKIEELTLYMLKQQEVIETLKSQLVK